MEDFVNFLTDLPELPVFVETYNNQRVSFGSICSWRGIHAEPSLTLDGDKPLLPSEIIDQINRDLELTHTGWKGGEYIYGYDDEIHFDDAGCYNPDRILRFVIGEEIVVYAEQ